MIDLKGKSFLTLKDFTMEEIEYLLDLSKRLKIEKRNGNQKKRLENKNIALIFEKESLRTRCSFEVSAHDMGANVTYINSSESHIGSGESLKDSARVLGRMFDGIEYRGFSQRNVEILAEYSKLPVWNGLTDEDHPTQVLADFLTAKEYVNKPFNEMNFVYIGDGRNNVANALMIGASKVGMNFKIITPKSLFPDNNLVEQCKKYTEISGGSITVSDNISENVNGADIVYTDVWLSMGEKEELWKDRIDMLIPYQVNKQLIDLCNNNEVKFMHCLPSFHNLDTSIARKIHDKLGLEALEVTDEVFESENSIVFDEAENRLHTIKAVMVATLGNQDI
ncbi:ornithine carbamoyltransferase [Clostridium tyrobutyricum]|uniref:ornithine carbamoyltransferase n=1 Tax=Clostridium tyrobutyricum TaxID=1519 RepID=UPI00073DAB34|nr:ornithine carbamoyltransferase [Clostridium tyrobutyricum]MBV4425002.1 ornithine carbamoyltransferase [Clostridium tyrobutyricum]MBV4427271.1 ornithine carbamoyltransferase [Clostridium tyrobutyricum]MBV4437009.1 ornithine carbamoyltransferase [Clostridium tyrobutyricum]MBV4439650.1 ornithine carbamoyltransferase [Clostridium tyrobutyricum]MBV4442394.1 ornithine carbamoyltransferase [Clostridium tyrobutyricum]